MKEFFRDIARKKSSHVRIIPIIRHPDTNRHNKSEFLAKCNFFRKHFCSRCTKSDFILFFIYLVLRRHSWCNVKNSSVRQRHSYLKSRCQTHLIYIEINIAFKPDLNIYIRHFSQRIKTFRFLVNPPRKFDRKYVRIVFFQNPLLLILFHDICISDIKCL